MDIKPLDTEQIGLKTLEKHLIRSKSEVSLKIGLPKEISNDERRVSSSRKELEKPPISPTENTPMPVPKWLTVQMRYIKNLN